MDGITSSRQKRIGFGTVFRTPGTNLEVAKAGETYIRQSCGETQIRKGIRKITDTVFDCTHFLVGDDAEPALVLDAIDQRIKTSTGELPYEVQSDDMVMPDKSWREGLPPVFQKALEVIDRRKRALSRGRDKLMNRVREMHYEEIPPIAPQAMSAYPCNRETLLQQAGEYMLRKQAHMYPAKAERLAESQAGLAKAS